MAAYFFASPIDVDIKLEGEEGRKQVEMKSDKEKTISCPVYYDGDSVSGTVRARAVSFPRRAHLVQVAIRVRDGKKMQHDGIKVEFVGSIGMCVTCRSAIGHLGRARLASGCRIPSSDILNRPCAQYLTYSHFSRTILRPGTPPRVSLIIAGARSPG
jgi:hypothetical protein